MHQYSMIWLRADPGLWKRFEIQNHTDCIQNDGCPWNYILYITSRMCKNNNLSRNSSGRLWKWSSIDGVFFIMRLSDAETGEEWEIGAGERCSFKGSWFWPCSTYVCSQYQQSLPGYPLEKKLLLLSACSILIRDI